MDQPSVFLTHGIEKIFCSLIMTLNTLHTFSFVMAPKHFSLSLLLIVAADSKFLKTLLSFAVGGLLGDVFLHLLPEAWEFDMNERRSNGK